MSPWQEDSVSVVCVSGVCVFVGLRRREMD